MNIFNRIWKTIKNIFKIRATQDNKEVSKNDLEAYYNVKGKGYSNRFYVDNPNLYVRTQEGYVINNLSFYYAIYRANYQFRTVINQLTNRITALDIEFEPAQEINVSGKKRKVKRVNDYIARQLETIGGYNYRTGQLESISELIKTMCEAFITGKTILQIKYKTTPNGAYDLESGYFEIDKIEYCNPDLFDFLPENNRLVYVEKRSQPELLNPYQFIVHAHNGTDINPHGETIIGLAGYRLHYKLMEFWSDYIEYSKRHGYASWEVVAKSYISKIDDEKLPPEPKIIEQAIELSKKITNGSSIGHTDDLEIRQIPDEAGNFDYVEAIELTERAISKLIIGSTTVIQNSETNGSQALGNVHERATDAIIEQGAKEIQRTLNLFIKKLLELNGLYDEDISFPKINIKYRKDIIEVEEVEAANQSIQNGAPVLVSEYMRKAKLSIPSDLDENLTFHGYWTRNGEYKEGLLDQISNNNENNNNILSIPDEEGQVEKTGTD